LGTLTFTERLVESGLVEACGGGKSRSYIISVRVYRQLGPAVRWAAIIEEAENANQRGNNHRSGYQQANRSSGELSRSWLIPLGVFNRFNQFIPFHTSLVGLWSISIEYAHQFYPDRYKQHYSHNAAFQHEFISGWINMGTPVICLCHFCYYPDNAEVQQLRADRLVW
jgi:hypothetical protein